MRIRPLRTSPAMAKMDFAVLPNQSVAKPQVYNPSDESQSSSRLDLSEQVKVGYVSPHEKGDETTNVTYLKPDFLDPLINTKVDSVCSSPLAMLARTCQNIGQMIQQPKPSVIPTTSNANANFDQTVPSNLTRHRLNSSLMNTSNTSANCVPESKSIANSVCTTGLVNSLYYTGSGTATQNQRTGIRPSESKSQGDASTADLVPLYTKRSGPVKAKRSRLEQNRHHQAAIAQRASPSPTRNSWPAHSSAHDKQTRPGICLPYGTTTSGQQLSNFSSPASNSPVSHGALAYSTANGNSGARNRPESLSPSNEYLSDCGNGVGNSSNALAQLARLSSSLPLPDAPRSSGNGFHSNQTDTKSSTAAGPSWFDPLRIQTGAKRQRPGSSQRQSTTSHSVVGQSGGAPKPSSRHPNSTSMSGLSSPAASYSLPLLFPGCSTSPTYHSSAANHTLSSNQYTATGNSNNNSSSTASSSSLSPPVPNAHSQWFNLINSLQHMASVQHQKDEPPTGPTGHETDVLSYQLAHNFLDYFYSKMKNGTGGDLHPLLSNQLPGAAAGSLPMAMELATAAVAAAAMASNRPEREYRHNGVRGSPGQHQSSSSSSPTSFGPNHLASAPPISAHSQSSDLFCQGKPVVPPSADSHKCNVCGHVCRDLQDFYTHFYIHLMVNGHMAQQQEKLGSLGAPNWTTLQDAANSSLGAYDLTSGMVSPKVFPLSGVDQMTGPLGSRDHFIKTLFNDCSSAIGVNSVWSSRDSMMRWLASYRNFVPTPTESKLIGSQSHGGQFVAPPTTIPGGASRDSCPRFENGGSNPLQTFETSDPRFMWMRLMAEHAMPTLFSSSSPTTAGNGTPPTNAPLPMPNPMLSPLNMANAYLTLFPQV